MKLSHALISLAIFLPILLALRGKRALWQFRYVILCTVPNSWPVLKYSNYGCYCGKGGSGTPVDDLDRCCQVHDDCYGRVMHSNACLSILDIYTYNYQYECDQNVTTYDHNTTDYDYNTSSYDQNTTTYDESMPYDQNATMSFQNVTCLSTNDACGMSICECDRMAAICFAQTPFILAHVRLPKENCKED